jgi:hypothetical protein
MKRGNQAVRAASYLPIGSIASFANYNLRPTRVSSVNLLVYISEGGNESGVRQSFVAAPSVVAPAMTRGQVTAPWASRL